MDQPTTAYRFSEEDKCFYFPCIFTRTIHAHNAFVAACNYKAIDIHEDLRTPSTTGILGRNEDTKRTVAQTFASYIPTDPRERRSRNRLSLYSPHKDVTCPMYRL